MMIRIRRGTPRVHALGPTIYASLCGSDVARDTVTTVDDEVTCLKCKGLLAKMAEKGMRR